MKSKREGRQIPQKIILVTAVFCLVISFIGIIMTGKLKKLFIQYIEDRVAEEADIMAQTAEEKFENEFQELRQIAYILQKEKISVEKQAYWILTVRQCPGMRFRWRNIPE